MIVRKRSSEVRQPHFLLLFGTELPQPLQGIFIAVATDAGRLVSSPASVFFLLHPVFFYIEPGARALEMGLLRDNFDVCLLHFLLLLDRSTRTLSRAFQCLFIFTKGTYAPKYYYTFL